MDFLGSNAEGHWFYYIAFLSACLMLAFFRGRRVRFVLPAMIMSLVIANPWFKELWENKLHMPYYWRILWCVPVIPLCAALPGMFSEKTENDNIKGLIALLCAGIFALSGSYMYTQKDCEFEVPATNTSKYRQRVVDVAEYILGEKEQPRIVADLSISIYIRQYTGKIQTMYGRDIEGYVIGPSDTATRVYQELSDEDGDMQYVAQTMLDQGYDYLVTRDENEKRKQQLLDNGFVLQVHIDDFGIYTVEGIPTKITERNNLGQTISVTNVNENGEPVIGKNGYATISYEYDKNGYIIREFRTDPEGKGIANEDGYAGYERVLDSRGKVIEQHWLDIDGKPV